MGFAGANQFHGQLEGGYRFDLGSPSEMFLTPFVRLQAYTGTQNAFTEAGAGSLNRLGFAANTAIADATSIYVRYDGEVSGQDNAHAFTAGIRMTW